MAHVDRNPDAFPQGTVLLEDKQSGSSKIILSPTPSDDPDDPLNWTPLRKAVNFGLTCSYVFFTFVLIDINYLAYRPYIAELGLDYGTFNLASGCSLLGLAVGCLLFRNHAMQFVAAIWWANFHKRGGLLGVSLLAGLAGSISEAIVMITINDMFFVHQHARFNGIFVIKQSLGTTGGPSVCGYIVSDIGWRWIDTKTPASATIATPVSSQIHRGRSRKSYRQRLAFVTKSPGSIIPHFYQPLIIFFSFPAVAYAATTYGTILAFFSASSSAGSYFFIYPPYNFGPSTIGLFQLGSFVGSLIGMLTIPWLIDWLIIKFAKRNEGVFEPEMRLWMSIPAAGINCAAMILYGCRGWHWAILAFAMDVASTYLSDAYPEILADALIAVVFIRNGFASIIRFSFTDWLNAIGIEHTFLLIGLIALVSVVVPILLLRYGKAARIRTAERYRLFAERQVVQRGF
ncbi:major facilitator superfamily domain-containing protein [Aspergillus crustosus]